MPQAVWVGSLSFGLVNIPVKLYTATSPKRVQFHQYEAGTGRRVRYRRVAQGPSPDDVPPRLDETEPEPSPFGAPSEAGVDDGSSGWDEPDDSPPVHGGETEVEWEDIVKGYEIEPGRVVTVDAEELESLAPERSRVLEVEQFVDLRDIDPVHFEKSYYLVPQPGAVTERPYWLLYRAMEEAKKVAIGRFVMRTKEYLVAVRAAEHVLMLETLFYADEVRDPKEFLVPSVEEPSERELELAHRYVEALGGEWEPARHRDEHRERLLSLLQDKAGDAIEVPEEKEETRITPATDLMEALQASIEAARQAREEEGRRTG
jgi:DNA end-binding protein Ku